MQPCNRIYYSRVYWRLNMFRAAYRSSSGVQTVFAASGLYIHVVPGRCPGWVVPTQPGQRPGTTCVYKPETANTVWSSLWWAVCRSKHVEPSINSGIINSIRRLHLVGYFYWFTLICNYKWNENINSAKRNRDINCLCCRYSKSWVWVEACTMLGNLCKMGSWCN